MLPQVLGAMRRQLDVVCIDDSEDEGDAREASAAVTSTLLSGTVMLAEPLSYFDLQTCGTSSSCGSSEIELCCYFKEVLPQLLRDTAVKCIHNKRNVAM